MTKQDAVENVIGVDAGGPDGDHTVEVIARQTADGGLEIVSMCELPNAVSSVEWQPIETAPKDRAVLLWLPLGRPVIGRWDAQPHHRKPRPLWINSDSVLFGNNWTRMYQPTHWQPLPEGPK